ncbi:unnamed protein product [Calypogeia fissa]
MSVHVVSAWGGGCTIFSRESEGRFQKSHAFGRGAHQRAGYCTLVGRVSSGIQRIQHQIRCEAAATTVSKTDSRKGPSMSIPPPAHPTYQLLDIIRYALAEDAGDRGDITCFSTIPPETKAQAQFLAKADGIIAGIDLAEMIFREVDPELKVEWQVQDADAVTSGLRFGSVNGNARSILIAERVVLNFMQRMSGIATSTKKMAEAARPARILDTRKTAPGLRLVDKWAVLIGSGENHRMGLYDMMMVKDNHTDVAGGIKNAIAAADHYIRENNLDVGVEMETRTLKEVEEVLECIKDGSGKVVTRIMLDNMVKRLPEGGIDVSMLQQAVKIINGVVDTEASGNVTLQTVKEIGATGVTYISSGALTHSVEALDISLKVIMQVHEPKMP